MFFKTGAIDSQRCSLKKIFRKKFAKFTGKYLCSSLFFNKVDHVTIHFHFWFYKLFLQNSHSQVFLKVAAPKIFASHRKKPVMELFFCKVSYHNFTIKRTSSQEIFSFFATCLWAKSSVPFRPFWDFTSIPKAVVTLHFFRCPKPVLPKQ